MITLLAITSIRSDAHASLDEYLSVVGPLMTLAGAKVVQRYELADTISGEEDAQFITVIEYPDAAAVKSVFESPEYKSLTDIKRQAFSRYSVRTVASH